MSTIRNITHPATAPAGPSPTTANVAPAASSITTHPGSLAKGWEDHTETTAASAARPSCAGHPNVATAIPAASPTAAPRVPEPASDPRILPRKRPTPNREAIRLRINA